MLYLTAPQLLISIFALSSKDYLAKNISISQAGGEGGERIKKNGIAGKRVYDDFWNPETPGASFICNKHPCKLKYNVLKYKDD